jgi:inner membrane protease subunit 2
MSSFLRYRVAKAAAAATAASTATAATTPKASPYNAALRYSYYFLLGAATLSTVNTLLVELISIEGPSMSPTLSPSYATTRQQDTLLALRRAPLSQEYSFFTHARNSVKRGDIVTFTKPHKPEEESVKRVLAVEGDTVWRDVRRVGIEEKMGGKRAKDMGMLPLGPVVKVPIGHVWVEGDNWRESLDSNDFGPISLSLVTGRASRIVWPLERWGRIPDREVTKDSSRTRVVPGPVFYPSGFEQHSG